MNKKELRLIDIENLAGCPIPNHIQVEMIECDLNAALNSDYAVQSVIACNHLASPSLFGFSSPARRLLKSGPNGADYALLGAEDHEVIAQRYSRVVIGSGDHGFALLAKFLVTQGVEVIVVAREGSLSRALEKSASRVVLLAQPQSPTANEMSLVA